MGNIKSTAGGGGKGKDIFSSFPGSTLVDVLNCGSLDDTEDTPRSNKTNGGGGTPHKTLSHFFSRMNTEELCTMSPVNSDIGGVNAEFDKEYEEFRPRNAMDEQDSNLHPSHSKQQLSMSRSQSPHPIQNPSPNTAANSSQLFAKALVSEVTDNPKTMTPAVMAEREKRLLKAQVKARTMQKSGKTTGPRPVGVPGGVGQPSVLGSIAHVLTGNVDSITAAANGGSLVVANNSDDPPSSVLPPNSLSENRAAQEYSNSTGHTPRGGKYTVTIGLSVSRRSSVGHLDTVTRQTAFDFNELQDRDYKYVSSTDASGWRAGGGERGGNGAADNNSMIHGSVEMNDPAFTTTNATGKASNHPGISIGQEKDKVAAPDTVHIPIIHIDADSPQAVDVIISAMASGEVFIPHMAIIPEALSVNGVSPPDLVVRFGTERNEDFPPDEWPNWCLEFMHNQLYEYFHGMGARWMKRPFSITLAKKVRWKTVKHMNRYFAHAERIIDAWREKGPQYLDPQLAYVEGGAAPEEVARPHGIYLLRNGVPTNYFAPNFDPPYTTKMTRSLLYNVLGKSWDKKRREWTSQPIPRLVTPAMLVTAMCGCGENQTGGFVATEATLVDESRGSKSTLLPQDAAIRSAFPREDAKMERNTPKAEAPMMSNSGRVSPLPKSDISSRNNQAFAKMSNTAIQNGKDPNEEDHMVANGEYPQTDRIGVDAPDDRNDDDQLNARLDLLMSNSFDESEAYSTHASKSAISAASIKYRRSPTPPERSLRSQRSNAIPLSDEDAVKEEFQSQQDLDRQRQEEEKENGNPAVGNDPVPNSDVAARDVMQSSMGATHSDIFHMKHQLKREQDTVADEKKEDPIVCTMASDEDWLDEVGKPIPAPKPDPNTDDDIMASLERESRRHLELIALAQEKTTSKSETGSQRLHILASAILEEALSAGTKSSSPSFCGTHTADSKSPSMRRSSSTNVSTRSKSPSLRKNDSGTSGISLDYSIDSTLIGETSVGGSTLNSTVGGSTVGSSLLGQLYAAEGSTVMSTGTRETLVTAKEGIMQDVLHEGSQSGEESQDSAEDIIPTDEELYAIGWAKALDQRSGSYYYFALDRSQTVWENPLASPYISQSQSDESLEGANPDRAAMI